MMPMVSFVEQMMGAARLDVRTFEEVEADPAALQPAMVDEGGRSSFAEESNDFPWKRQSNGKSQKCPASWNLEPPRIYRSGGLGIGIRKRTSGFGTVAG
jgi:hypothetical protein